MRMPRALATTALLTVATASLTACGRAESAPPTTSVKESDGARIASASSKSTSASASGTTTATRKNASAKPSVGSVSAEVPEAAKAHTEEGAKAFLEHFYVTMRLGYVSPAPKALTNVMSSDCSACQTMQGQIDKLREEGHHYDYPYSRLSHVVSSDQSVQDQVILAYDIEDAAGTELDSDGHVVRKLQAQRSHRVALVAWGDQGWRVVQIGSHE